MYNFISIRIARKMKRPSANITQNILYRNYSDYFSIIPLSSSFFLPGYSIFTLLRSIKLFLRCMLDLHERVFFSSLCCNSVLIKLVSSKGKLLSVPFYHRPLPPSSTEQFITAHHPFLKLISLHVDLHIALVKVWEQSRNFQKDILLILYITVL